jgi:putative copper resistance protein D
MVPRARLIYTTFAVISKGVRELARAAVPEVATAGLERLVRALPAVLALTLVGLAAAPLALAHVGRTSLPLTPWSALTSWGFEPFVLLGLLVALDGYLVLVLRVNERHPDHPAPRWRTAAWIVGLIVIFLALNSSIDVYADDLFSIHMIQHVLLTIVAAPLLVMGAPITLLLRAASPGMRRRRILPILDSLPVRVLTHPIVTWALFSVVMWASHFSPLYQAALVDDRVHVAEHLLYLVAGYLFWTPIVGADPLRTRLAYPLRLGYLVLEMASNSFLSLAIWQADDVLYPAYATFQLPGWLAPIDDQHLAGGLMMVLADIVLLVIMLGIVWAWLEAEEREGRRIDDVLARQRAREDAVAHAEGQGRTI